MLGKSGEILYIGKAKRLRKRVASYRNVKHATHPPHLVRMVGLIHEIRWEVCRSEAHALAREYELLHAVRPPYNTADTEEACYLFVTLRPIKKAGHYELRLTSEPEASRDVMIFGCYKDRIHTKRGFSALLRLLYAAFLTGSRFSIPSVLRRARVEFDYTMPLDDAWVPLLAKFLRGENLAILREISQRLIENENVPRFMGPSLQDDIDCARRFFAMGPKSTRLLKRKHKLRARVLTHSQMDELIQLTMPNTGTMQQR